MYGNESLEAEVLSNSMRHDDFATLHSSKNMYKYSQEKIYFVSAGIFNVVVLSPEVFI